MSELGVFEPGDSLKSKRILLVDDSRDNQEIVTYQLTRSGARVESAYDGNDGVVMAMTRDFDLILMDLHMPILDGCSATRMLRDMGYLKPILAFTAHAHPEMRDRCRSSGCTGFVTKPAGTETLVKVIREALGAEDSARLGGLGPA